MYVASVNNGGTEGVLVKNHDASLDAARHIRTFCSGFILNETDRRSCLHLGFGSTISLKLSYVHIYIPVIFAFAKAFDLSDILTNYS